MESLKQRWKNLPGGIRKPLVLIVGVLIVIAGIILLPLPGPGWVVIFAGFALLATEFEPAEKVRDWLVSIFKIGANWLKELWRTIRGKEPAEPSKPPVEYDATAEVGIKPQPKKPLPKSKH